MTKNTLEKLKRLNKNTQESNRNDIVLRNAINFCEILDNDPKFAPINKQIDKIEVNAKKNLGKLESEYFTELENQKNELKNYVRNNSDTLKKSDRIYLEKCIVDFESYDHKNPRKRRDILGNKLLDKKNILLGAFSILAKDITGDHLPFVSKFYKVTCIFFSQEIVINPKSEKCEKYINEEKKVKLTEHCSIWASRNHIFFIYNVYKNNETVRKRFREKGEHFNAAITFDFYEWLAKTIQNKNYNSNEYDIEKIKSDLELLFLFIENHYNDRFQDREEKTIITNNWEFDDQDEKLHTPFESFDFSKASHAKEFLGLFFPGGKPIQDMIDRDTVWENTFAKIDDKERITGKKEHSQVYNTKRLINKKTENIGFPLIIIENCKLGLNTKVFLA